MTDTNGANRSAILTALGGPGPFVVTSHRRPDGDSLGSTLALVVWLRERGAHVTGVSADGVPAPYTFLPSADTLERDVPGDVSRSVAVVLDTPLLGRVGDDAERLEDAKVLINIDHHPANDNFGTLNFVDPGASSTALMIHELLTDLDAHVSSEVASLLYVGLLTDTGGFRFGNTDARTLATASALAGAGADAAVLASGVYGEQPVGNIRLLGLVLGSIETALDGRVAMVYLTDAMRATSGVTGESIEGLPSYARLVSGVEVALLFREEGSRIRVSLRSKGRADVNAIARELGGGGHAAAAGLVLEGTTLAEAKARVLAAIPGFLP